CFSFFNQTGRAPCQCRTAKLHCKHVCDQPCMPAIAVRKRMGQYQPMMKSNGYLIERVCVVLNPIANVTQQGHESLSNFVELNSDVFFGASILARPLPCLVEHLP